MILEEPVTVLPWLLPIFKDSPAYQQMVKEDILMLSKDEDTFIKSVEGCEDDQYDPLKNSKLIVLLREQDKSLQKIRFALVQNEKRIDVCFEFGLERRMITSGAITSSVCFKLSRITSKL